MKLKYKILTKNKVLRYNIAIDKVSNYFLLEGDDY